MKNAKESRSVKRLKIKHLSIRMTLYYSAVILISLIILAVSVSTIFSTRWIEEMNLVINQKFDLVSNHLDSSINKVRNLQFSMVNNEIIYSLMEKAKKEGSLDMEDESTLRREFEKYRQKDSSIVSCYAVSSEKKILDPWYVNKPYDILVSDNPDFQYFCDKKMLGYFTTPNTFPLQIENPGYDQLSTLTYYGQYYDTENYEGLGYVVLNLKRSGIFADIDSICRETFGTSYVVNENNVTIYRNGDPLTGMVKGADKVKALENSENRGSMVTVDGRKYLMYSKLIANYPYWRLVGLVDYQDVLNHIREVNVLIAAIATVMLLIVVIVSFYISHKVTNPIRSINKSMALLGNGIWPQKVEAVSSDEVAQLVDGFNTMSENIKNLQEKILEEQDQKQKIELTMVKSQLDLLESQINPHFIHNTLNTLKYMAQKEGNMELSETITSFNTLLRASMSQGNDLITVAEEINNIQNYLNIQRHRYDVDIIIHCYAFQNAEYALLPKLILQPLVENSLFHGIVPKRGGEIAISFEADQRYLYVSVSDTGVGIEEEKLKNILEIKKGSSRGYNNIGLANVNERLVIYYGEESHLQILSSREYGTFISFKIPYTK